MMKSTDLRSFHAKLKITKGIMMTRERMHLRAPSTRIFGSMRAVTALIGTVCVLSISSPAPAQWGAGQETIAGKPTWLYKPNSPIEGNERILNGKRALVLVLHGCAQSATELKEFGNWEPTAEEYGMVVAVPDVVNGVIAGCWDYDGARDQSGHVQDVLDLVANLKARPELEIDPQQVYITGLSSGAALSLQAACEAPEVFAGVGAVAGPSVGSDQQNATGSPPVRNVSRAVSKCLQLAGEHEEALATQIASVAYGDLDKNGGGTPPIPPPLQGATPLVDVRWTEDNAAGFIELFGASDLGNARPIQEGKGEERVSGLDDKDVVSLLTMFGVGHAWPSGSGDTSLGGGNWINKVGVDYPAYVTEWFFANNRRTGTDDDRPRVRFSLTVSDRSIVVAGNATDPDGTIVQVDIELVGYGSHSVSVDANGDFSSSFDDLADGTYTVRVVAVDDEGETSNAPPQTTTIPQDACTEFRAANFSHVNAGRATVNWGFGGGFGQTFAVGSGDAMGSYFSFFTETTLAETSQGFFEVGACR